VIGDAAVEGNEIFAVNVTNVMNASLGDGAGVGTIVDDDQTAEPAPFVVINEIDADTPGADVAEFIELYDGGLGNTSLAGLALVFFNGSNDVSYAVFDLDGQTATSSSAMPRYLVLMSLSRTARCRTVRMPWRCTSGTPAVSRAAAQSPRPT
jgi:hypothetical protein